MGFGGFHKYGQAFDEGKFHYQYVTKTTQPTPGTAGYFVDLNQTSGQPKYNAFAGSQATFTPLEGSGNAGIYVGPFGSGSSTKHLARWQVLNNSTAPDLIYLNDYLGFYPLIDCDNLDLQEMDNTLSLTRYTNGEGVRIVLIVQAPMTSTASITINYVNTQNISISSTANLIPGLSIGVCATGTGNAGGVGEVTPFFSFGSGCTGVKYIESVQLSSSAGGFICAALVKPLAQINTYENASSVEKVYGFENQNPPEIKPNAYLNFLLQRSSTAAGSLRSELIFINS